MTQKVWVITMEPQDKSGDKRTLEALNARKKIAQVEEYLCELYIKMTGAQDDELKAHIIRVSGVMTTLEKAPYIFTASLISY